MKEIWSRANTVDVEWFRAFCPSILHSKYICVVRWTGWRTAWRMWFCQAQKHHGLGTQYTVVIMFWCMDCGRLVHLPRWAVIKWQMARDASTGAGMTSWHVRVCRPLNLHKYVTAEISKDSSPDLFTLCDFIIFHQSVILKACWDSGLARRGNICGWPEQLTSWSCSCIRILELSELWICGLSWSVTLFSHSLKMLPDS